MNIIVRILVTMGLLALLAFCAFGFLASFEPLPASQQWLWRLVYLVAASSACWALVRLWRSLRPGA
jgi:hypothetical protein